MVAQLDKNYISTRPGRAVARAVTYAFFEGRPLTTRGRWINPWLLRRAKKISARSCDSAIDRPLFILGTGRSGTTILGKILSMHRDVGWLNEPKLMWHVARSDEDLNGNYTSGPARYRLDAADATSLVRQAMTNQYATYLRATRNRRVLDKYPELIFRAAFIKELFPDARFLFLVRNGYATCRSIARWSETHGQRSASSTADWWGVDNRKWHLLVEQVVRNDPDLSKHADAIADFRDHTAMAAVEWMLTMREGIALLDQYPDSTLMINYEHLTHEPRSCLQDILRFSGLDSDPTMLRYAEQTLRPVSETVKLELPKILQHDFDATLGKLGYPSG